MMVSNRRMAVIKRESEWAKEIGVEVDDEESSIVEEGSSGDVGMEEEMVEARGT